jgi:hypothetical protein
MLKLLHQYVLCFYHVHQHVQYNTARFDTAAPINSASAGAATDTTATSASTAGKKGADKGTSNGKDTKAVSPLKVPRTIQTS